MEPVFDIVIVSRNAGDKLLRTVKSVLAQTWRDLQITVQDGASTDGSIEALRTLLDETPERAGQVTVISERDDGIYDAMNRALSALPAQGGEPRFVYFLNCGDLLDGERTLERVAHAAKAFFTQENAEASLWKKTVLYGDVTERVTGQRVASNPLIDDFACYRNVPCHQACFYARDLMRERFDPRLKVRADYEHFLRLRYRHGAVFHYLPLVIADYEGGGFSETKENLRRSEQERRAVIRRYLPAHKVLLYDLLRVLTLAPLRTYLARSPKTAAFYQGVKRAVYARRGREAIETKDRNLS